MDKSIKLGIIVFIPSIGFEKWRRTRFLACAVQSGGLGKRNAVFASDKLPQITDCTVGILCHAVIDCGYRKTLWIEI